MTTAAWIREAGLEAGIFDDCFVDHSSLRSTFRGLAARAGRYCRRTRDLSLQVGRRKVISVYTRPSSATTTTCVRCPSSSSLTPGVRYVCFTDRPRQLRPWEILPFPQLLSDAHRMARIPKMLPHLLLPEAEISIYMDGAVHALLATKTDSDGAS